MGRITTHLPMSPCPQCRQQTVQALEGINAYAHVSYYRCRTCGHVWAIDRRHPALPIHVTDPSGVIPPDRAERPETHRE